MGEVECGMVKKKGEARREKGEGNWGRKRKNWEKEKEEKLGTGN